MSKPPAEPHRVLPVAAGLQRGLDPARAVRGVPGRGGDEAAEQLLAARRLARHRGGGARAVVVLPAEIQESMFSTSWMNSPTYFASLSVNIGSGWIRALEIQGGKSARDKAYMLTSISSLGHSQNSIKT